MVHLQDISFPIERFKTSQRILFTACFMLFFWALFDGIISYITPLKISQSGFSDTTLGLIIGFSSIAGAFFDFFISKFVTNIHFRRIYLAMFALCFLYPFIIWQANSVWLFLIAMAIWGFYYDLNNFGAYDFVGRKFHKDNHASSFGQMDVFRELGYMIAPLIAGITLGTLAIVDFKIVLLLIILLTVSFSFYLILRSITTKDKTEFIEEITFKPLNIAKELFVWNKIGHFLIPPLLITMTFNIYDSFFWTLGPILAESFKDLRPFNGLFLTAYTLPFLFVGWFVGSVTKKYGKNKLHFPDF